ncbi:class I SAM-dependent methyltransferase [Brevundimonas sp. SL161]|uniref:class I SAM-dependent methyltransferase n=1 Tax=Brevundimonas sp. SL161 TaxID=2804613 RepID=UPI003CEFDB3F
MNDTSDTRLLYQQDSLPIFQNRMYPSEAEARDCPKGDVRLVEDLETGLVVNGAFRPELMVYDAHYQNEQGVSLPFREHLDRASGLVQTTLGRLDLVEVGCGKGFFLEMLLADGVDVTGFDPTYEGDNPRVRLEYFSPGLEVSAKGLILRHVLEHVVDPVDFLMNLRDANGGQGLIYIEVPCFDWICENRAWFDIYYEHVNYFRLSDFSRMFGRVIHAERVFLGQYLAVVADLASLRHPQIDPADRAAFPDDFTATIPASAPPGGLVVWGGASKGVIFSLLCQRAGLDVAAVIDINTAKQGQYLAASGLRVSTPDEVMATLPPGSPIHVMNPNYLSEIRDMSNNAFTYIEVSHEHL